MPTIGAFHRKFWRARANTPPPPGVGTAWMYPGVQSVVAMHFGVSLEAIRPAWEQARWLWRLCRRLWWYRDPARQQQLVAWIAASERPPAPPRFGAEQTAILARVQAVLNGPYWTDARNGVRACANSPKFHHVEQWVQYGQQIKKDPVQAQNVYRHVRVVHELRAAHPDLTNPEAHLVTELAYQGLAACPDRPRQVYEHPVFG